jgi:hypothetical protein
MSIQVTPGFGTTISTDLKGGAHHQRVISHTDHNRIQIVPLVIPATYSPGQCIGGEINFLNATRYPGDYAYLDALQIIFRNSNVAAELDMIFYSDVLTNPPINGVPPAFSGLEITKVLGIVHIQQADFLTLSEHKIANVNLQNRMVLKSSDSISSIRAVLITRSSIIINASDTLITTIITCRD